MPLVEEVRSRLAALGDPKRARGAQAYLKSTMPFHGVSAVPLRAMCRELFPTLPSPDAETWRSTVLEIWRGATHREEMYVAVELCGDRRARGFHDMSALPMFEEIIVTGAWWDIVDGIAAVHLGAILTAEPKPMRKAMTAWSKCDNLWKRRSAILCQLKFKERTDTALLYRFIEANLGSREFFINKAIGWALRGYAWTNPEEVRRYLDEMGDRLAPLSRREAAKHL